MSDKSSSGKKIKHPIQRDIIAGSVIFVILVCVVLSMHAYYVLTDVLTSRYEDLFEDVLMCAEHKIDTADLEECIRTRTASQKYEDLQEQFDYMVDDFDLEHLYCIIPSNTTITNVVSAVSQKGRDAGETHKAIGEIYGYFPNDELKRYSSFWKNDDVTFFEELTWDGMFYTGAIPVKNDVGRTIALICVDVSVTNISDLIMSYIRPVIFTILLLSIVFAALILFWMRRQIIVPIRGLEESVSRFADNSHRMKDIADLELSLPEIRRKNEVESLASAIDKMSSDMQAYVKDILNVEDRAESAKKEAEDMSTLAFRDSLTQVRSKAAYDIKIRELNDKIMDGTARFGFVMIDLNHLKAINDNCGHAKGDAYLIGSCRQICSAYPHSPVYRIGGDEFIVILEDDDYDRRDRCFSVLSGLFSKSRKDPNRPVWECYSAAAGMSVYQKMPGETAEEVFRRADAEMYSDKQFMKKAAATGALVDRGRELAGGRQ